MSSLSVLEAELAEAYENVKVCDEMLALAPEDNDAKETKAYVQGQITDLKAKIEELRLKQEAPPPPPADNDVPPPPPKYDMSKHPKFQKQSADPPPPPSGDAHVTFNVKDVVMAKWSEDKQWYQATIVAKTGSSSDPVYTVTFKGYGNTENKRKYEVRPFIDNSKKRKLDEKSQSTTPNNPTSTPASSLSGANNTTSGVISAAPDIDPKLVPTKREPSKVSDGPTRLAPEPKKLKGSKALDKAKNSWSDWQKTGPKKAPASGSGIPKKKDSQFRTPDLPTAKVGFTGSGQGMQKDQPRAKWLYDPRARDAAGDDD